MGQARVDDAIGRIERALARIEAAASRPPAPAEPQDGDVPALLEAHRALRHKVETAIGRIDGLIASGEAA
jgi:hypothetical protein